MFPMPRVVYCMATDGLVFEFFSYLIPSLQTPSLAALATGSLASIFILIFDLNQLIEMMSITSLHNNHLKRNQWAVSFDLRI